MKGLKEFLENTEQEELKIEMLPIEDINALLKPHGFEINHETLDTNGWSIDFWVLFENEHYPFDLQLGGSWYYGNYVLTKTKTDEEW